ncbi:MAG TPA: glycosyltransferase [Pyrinomonadaceae bacterium]|jgi:glycosyltransferase involved in cell wall biosynthesis|nr:glycosyltransferase [Pyrinomonadaceae bacterium]
MKVVRIIARLNVGGPAKHVAWLTAGTRRAGIESELIAGTVPPGEDDMSYFAAGQGIEPIILPEMTREVSPKDAVTVWKLYHLFRRLRPDIVHTHTAKAGTVGRAAGLCYRWLTPSALVGRPRACRFVHTYHGHIFHSYYGRLKTLFFLTIERFLARVATDRIVAISQQQFREIHGRFGVGRARQFTVIPLGLDVEAFANWRERRAAARVELGAGADELLVGIVGRLTEIKNHKLFIEAAHAYLMRQAGGTGAARRVRFVVIGDGQLRGELEAQARALGIAERVTFTGMRSDPENFYPALDIVALTSLNEGTPLTLIEAMANARPVVATAVGGVVDLVGRPVEHEAAHGMNDARAATNREADAASVAAATAATTATGDVAYAVCERGVRVRTGDAEAFCEALRLLVSDEELRRALGERGRAFVVEHYSKERLVADVLNLYEELMSPRRLPDSKTRRTTTASAATAGATTKQGSVPGIEPARGKGD